MNGKRWMAGVLALLLAVFCPLAALTEEQEDTEAAMTFLMEDLIYSTLSERYGGLTVRAAYVLRLPEEMEGIHYSVAEEYGGFDRIILFELGYCRCAPIVESTFAGIGVRADGEMEIVAPPSRLMAFAEDLDVMAGVEIERIGTAE